MKPGDRVICRTSNHPSPRVRALGHALGTVVGWHRGSTGGWGKPSQPATVKVRLDAFGPASSGVYFDPDDVTVEPR
jgi:hypothetical protein